MSRKISKKHWAAYCRGERFDAFIVGDLPIRKARALQEMLDNPKNKYQRCDYNLAWMTKRALQNLPVWRFEKDE